MCLYYVCVKTVPDSTKMRHIKCKKSNFSWRACPGLPQFATYKACGYHLAPHPPIISHFASSLAKNLNETLLYVHIAQQLAMCKIRSRLYIPIEHREAMRTLRIGISYTYIQNRGWLYVYLEQGLVIHTFKIVVGYMYIQNRDKLYLHSEQGLAIHTFRIGIGYRYIQDNGRMYVHTWLYWDI